MRIAHVNQPMDMLVPPHQNSLGIWTYEVAPRIAATHDVVVYGKRSAAQNAWNGSPGVRYDFIRPLVPNRRLIDGLDRLPGRRLPAYASRLAHLDYCTQIGMKERSAGADIIHIQNFSQFVPTFRSIGRRLGIVLHMTGEWLTQLDHDVVERRLEQTDLVIGCSDHITDLVRDRFPRHAGRCTTIHNGVDTERFSPTDGPTRSDERAARRVLFVGRISPEKGLHDLVRAFVLVASENPDVELDLIGPQEMLPREFIIDVSDDPAVRDLARFYDRDYVAYLRGLVPAAMSDRVRFLGGLPQDELVSHYRAADLVVNPSYSESFGMSLVEAQACGTPVVATRVGGMIDIVSDDVGTLVGRGDVPALVDAISRLLGDDSRRQRMGAAGRCRAVERFGWDRVAASLLTTYERLDAPD